MNNSDRLSRNEFVALIATMFGILAFSIDAMLPGLPDIGAALSPADPNRAQLIVVSFILGMGVGTLFTGPLSDAYGRKPIIIGGIILYCIGAFLASQTQSLELMILARILQGVGAAGPRIAGVAMVRDTYAGVEMAKIMSFVMMVFMVLPAAAPAIGELIIAGFGWRAIFAAFIIFALAAGTWLSTRQPETHPVENRTPMKVSALLAAMREVTSNRIAMISIAVQACVMGILFGNVSSIQPIMDITYGRGEQFAAIFAGMALFSASASFINAKIVSRFGMRKVIYGGTMGVAILTSICMVAAFLFHEVPFALYIIWASGLTFSLGLTMGNLNALAMEPLGHIAGMAASIVGCLSTVGAVIIATPLGQMFNGTPVPLMSGALVAYFVAIGLMIYMGPREKS